MDTFIRGPVQIHILFNEPIHVSKIVLDAKLNAQISNGFVLCSSTLPVSDYDNNRQKYLDSFQQIGKVLNEKNKSAHVYEFTRRNDETTRGEESSQTVNRVFFNTKNPTQLTHLRALSISITRTLNSSNPCIRSLRVFGLCSSIDRSIDASKPSGAVVKRVEMPGEYLDELTHELMRVPMRLPSKRYVDKSTLDRYIKENTSKNPNEPVKDPFTRMPFGPAYQPLIDEELKSKIDKFLFENGSNQLVYKESRPQKRINLEESSDSSSRPLNSGDFAQTTKRLKTDKIISKCDLCMNEKNNLNMLYQVNVCKHNYCRQCLASIKNICPICRTSFKNNQLINYDRIFLN